MIHILNSERKESGVQKPRHVTGVTSEQARVMVGIVAHVHEELYWNCALDFGAYTGDSLTVPVLADYT